MQAIVFDKTVFRYPYTDYDVIEGLEMSVPCGKWTDVLIDEQSGKTTLCKLLMGLIKPNKGNIFYYGQDISQLSLQQRNILYLGRQDMLIGGRNVLYNVAYPLKVRKVRRRQRIEIATECLNKCGLEQYACVRTQDLDDSVKCAVAVCRALARRVDTVLCDDFFDRKSDKALQLLKDNFFNTTLVNFTSRIDCCVGQQTILIKDGKVVANGDRQEIARKLDGILWLAKEVKNGL